MAKKLGTNAHEGARVLIAKLGLDGHERGARMVARSLQDEGFEVQYSGIRQSPEEVAELVRKNDADILGISILSGAHNSLIAKVIDVMHDQNLDDVPIVVGGVIPDDDQVRLLESGVAAVFGPGTKMSDVIQAIKTLSNSLQKRPKGK